MNKKDLLTDFSVHLLLKEEETFDNELLFFVKNENTQPDYQEYVTTIKKFISDDYIWDSDIDGPIEKVSELTDIITEKEIIFFQDYLYSEFRFGYPSDVDEEGFVSGESYGINFSIEDIKFYFKEFLNLRYLNPYHYISYYQQYVNFLLSKSGIILSDIYLEINNFIKVKDSINSSLYSQLKDDFEFELRKDLLKNAQNTTFQVIGGFDENGFILNYDETLKVILKSNSSEITLPNLSVEVESNFGIIKYEYYKYKIDRVQSNSSSDEIKKLKEEFNNLKDKNHSQIEYLKERGFSNVQIDRVLNCFAFNKFNNLDIRHIRDLTKVNHYRLFYFFYRYDFLKKAEGINFEKGKDFESLALTEDKVGTKQYLKYHNRALNKIEPHSSDRHHPFDSISAVSKFIEKIETVLLIEKEKLNITQNLKEAL